MARFASLFVVLALGACAYPNQSGDSPGADPRTGTESRPEDRDRRTETVPGSYPPGMGTVESVTRA